MLGDKKKTILLVEDEVIIALAEKTTLEKFGYDVRVAHTGEEAVTMVGQTPGIDLVLMDINLGAGLDGTETAALILKERDIPVVFLSSHMEPDVVARTEKITSYGYVVKDSSATVLDASIKMAFKLFAAKISEKKKELALSQSNELITKLARLVPGVIYQYRLDPDGRSAFPYASPGINDIYEVTPEEVREDATPVFGRLHPDDYDMVAGAIQASALTLSTFFCEFRVLLPRQGLRWRWSQAHPERLPNGGTLWHGIISDITERKLADEALRGSEEQFRTLGTMAPIGIYLTDTRGLCRYANPRWCEMAGLTLEEALGNGWTRGLHPDDREAVFASWQRMIESEGRWGLEYRFRTGAGKVTWVQGLAAAQRDAQGAIIGYVGANIDITERRLAEEALKASEARAQALLSTIPDMLFRVDRRGVFLDYRADSRDLYDQSGASFIGKSCREILPPDFADLIDAKIRSALETGTLQTFNYRLPVPGRGVRDFEARMIACGADEATAIVRDVTESKRASKTLRETEERWRDILFSMADWVWEVDEKGVYTYSSDKGEELLGASRGDILGKTPFDFMPLEEAKRVGALFAGIVAQKMVIRDLENWNIGRNGERICLVTNGVPILDEMGNLKGYRGVDKDITGRKRAEEAIQDSLRFQQELLDAVPSPIFYKNADLVYIGGNKAFERYIGMEREQFIGKTVFDVAPADLAKKYDRADRELLKQRGVQIYEGSVVYADGTRHDVIFHKAPFSDSRGNVAGLIGAILDISDRKRAEEALRTSEAKQSNALQMTHAGHWEYDVDSDRFTFNDNFYRIFRTTAAAVGGYQLSSGEYARRFLHPDDMAMVGIETRAAIEATDANYSRQIEHRILYADGEVGHIAVRFFIVKDAQGRTIKTYGVNQDISQSKRAEEEIKRQLQEKETLLQEVHHRIKNNIATIGGILSLSMQKITSPEAVAALQDAIGRVDSMRVLYDKLLLSKDYQDISVKKYVESLTDAVVSLFPDQARIRLNQQFADFHLDPKRLFPLGIIINELLTNIMKYAFAGKKSGQIKLSLDKAGRRVTLVIQDNGIGLPDGFAVEGEKGFGLTLVKMLSQQLGGTFAIESRKGTRCTVTFDV